MVGLSNFFLEERYTDTGKYFQGVKILKTARKKYPIRGQTDFVKGGLFVRVDKNLKRDRGRNYTNRGHGVRMNFFYFFCHRKNMLKKVLLLTQDAWNGLIRLPYNACSRFVRRPEIGEKFMCGIFPAQKCRAGHGGWSNARFFKRVKGRGFKLFQKKYFSPGSVKEDFRFIGEDTFFIAEGHNFYLVQISSFSNRTKEMTEKPDEKIFVG